MQAGTVDPKELEISPEMQAKRGKIDVKNLGIGLFVSNSFFAWGFIVAKIWSKLVPSVSIHAYAWMIITVAICKIFNLLPENIEVACYQWFQFVMKNLTTTLLVGILGIASTAKENRQRRDQYHCLSEEKALEKAAWEVAVRCTDHKRGDHDLTYIPITPDTLKMKNGDLMVAYGLLPEIAVQVWNVMHRMPQKENGPKQQ